MLINVVLKIHKLPMNTNELSGRWLKGETLPGYKESFKPSDWTGQCYPEPLEEAQQRKSIDSHFGR